MCYYNPFFIKKWSYYPIYTCFTFFQCILNEILFLITDNAFCEQTIHQHCGAKRRCIVCVSLVILSFSNSYT